MATNEAVYGDADLWLKAGSYASDVSRNDMFLQPNFLGEETTSVENAYIKKGVDEGILKLNKPLDMSPCFCGMGSELPLAHINNYDYSRTETPKIRSVDNRSVFNWAIGRSLQSDQYALNIRNKEMMFAPDNDYTSIRFTGEYQGVRPMTNVPVKNAVLFPYVHVCSDLTVTAQAQILSLQEYVSEENTYTADYPYITHVFFTVYINTTTEPVSESHFRNIWANDAYKCLVEFDSNTVYENKTISNKTYSDTWQYHHSFCNFSGSTYGITFIGCLNSASRYHNISYENENEYVIRYTSDMKVEWCRDSAQYPFYQIGYITYYKGFEDYVKHALAGFGMFFTTDLATAQNGSLNSDKMHLGIIEADGLTHGNYSTGTENENQSQYGWNSSNDSSYVPESKPTDKNIYYTDSVKPHNVVGTTAFTTKYVLNFASLNSIADSFYTALDLKPDDMDFNNYNTSLFLTNNALDTIISCKAFPFEVPSSGSEVVQFGKFKTTVSAPVTNRKVTTFEFSGFSCFPENGDFRDYEPYTSYELKVPYCGSVKLQPSEVVGKNISVTLCVDIETGDTTAFIYADNQLIDSLSGNCAVDVPLSGIQQATLDSQVFNAALNQRQAKINSQLVTAKGIISIGGSAYGLAKSKGNPTALAKGLGDIASSATNFIQAEADAYFNEKRTDYDISHVQTPYKCIGAVSSGVGLAESQVCTLTKYSPVMLSYNASIYAKTIGYACLIESKLSAFKGFTVCSNADLSGFYATAEEKQAILQALQGGVIL